MGGERPLRRVCIVDALCGKRREQTGYPARRPLLVDGGFRARLAHHPGRTGSGKTQCAINTITFQIFQNVPHWGGVCLDQKGLYWEILVKMAAHFG